MSFNDYIRPSCMPMAGDSADVGEMVTCTGWGKPSDSAGGISPVLRMVEDRPIISNAECNSIYGIVGDGVVCIGASAGCEVGYPAGFTRTEYYLDWVCAE